MTAKREFCILCGRLIDGRDEFDDERTKVAREIGLCVGCDYTDAELEEVESVGESPTFLARVTRELSLMSIRSAKGLVIGACEAVSSNGLQCNRKASIEVSGRKFCSHHRGMVKKGTAVFVDAPRFKCLIAADTLEDAQRQVRSLWNISMPK